MPTKELQTEQEVRDFVRGCTFLGTGGGGSPHEGVELLLETLGQGKRIRWVDVKDIGDDVWTTSPAGMGTIAPVTEEKRKMFESLGFRERKVKRMLVEAVRELEFYLSNDVGVIVPIEIGGGNTPIPLDTAAQLDKVAVDGDYCGRAVPEAAQCLPALANKSITPMVCTDDWGNITIIKKVVSLAAAERLGKLVSTLATGLCGETFFTMRAREMKEVLIPGTLSQAYEIGKVIREARERGNDPVKAVAQLLNGWILFKGKVEKKDWEDRDGYMYGDTYLSGFDGFKGQEFRIWFKNENHITWKNGQLFVTSPDIVQVVDLKSAEPITNPDLSAGQEVAVVGVRARKQYHTKEGIAVLGPRHYGFDLDHVPIDTLL